MGWRWNVCRSTAGIVDAGATKVGVLGLNNAIGRGWSVCLSNVGDIEVRFIEVGV